MREFDPSKVQGYGPMSYHSFSQEVESGAGIRIDESGNFVTESPSSFETTKQASEISWDDEYSSDEEHYSDEEYSSSDEEYSGEDDNQSWFDQEFNQIMSNRDVISDRIDKLKSGFQEEIIEKAADIKTTLTDRDANPIKLMVEMDFRHPDWKEWEPETILATLESEGIEIHRVNQDKLMAIKVIYKQPDFFDSARVFEKVCVAFSNRIVDWGYVQEVRVHDIAATIAMVNRYILDLDFSDDVKGYIAASAVRDGYLILPEILSLAEVHFAQLLVENLGDDAIVMQDSVLEAINTGEVNGEEQSVQLLRYVRCSRHVAEKLNEIR